MKTFFILVTSLFSIAIFAQDSKPEFLHEGDKAPELKITTLDGRIIDTKQLKGKTIYLNFFATWCGPCMKELPRVETNIWQTIKDTNFVMVAIGREHSVEEITDLRTKKAYTMPMAADPKREAYSLFAPQNIPRNIVISKNGIVLWNRHGFEEVEFQSMIELIKRELKNE